MAMRGVYAVNFVNVTVSAQQDLFYFAPADEKAIDLLAVYLSVTPGDMGDAQEEGLRIEIHRGYTTAGSGGTTPTINKLAPGDATAGFTVHANDTTVATTAGAAIHADAMNNRAGWVYIPTPETVIGCSQAETSLVVRLVTTPADALSVSGTAYVKENY